MNKNSKKNVIAVLAASVFACAGFGVAAVNVPSVSADTTEDMFMVHGASVRLADDFYGLRFKMAVTPAYYETHGAGDYGMIIIPEDYLTTYATQLTANANDYVKTFSGIEALPLLNFTQMEGYSADEKYNATAEEDAPYICFNGVISSIKYNNLDRDFVAIGYYYDGETYDYAEFATEDNARNVVEVAELALNDNAIQTPDLYTTKDVLRLYEYVFFNEQKAEEYTESEAKAAYADYQAGLATRYVKSATSLSFGQAEDVTLASGDVLTLEFTVNESNLVTETHAGFLVGPSAMFEYSYPFMVANSWFTGWLNALWDTNTRMVVNGDQYVIAQVVANTDGTYCVRDSLKAGKSVKYEYRPYISETEKGSVKIYWKNAAASEWTFVVEIADIEADYAPSENVAIGFFSDGMEYMGFSDLSVKLNGVEKAVGVYGANQVCGNFVTATENEEVLESVFVPLGKAYVPDASWGVTKWAVNGETYDITAPVMNDITIEAVEEPEEPEEVVRPSSAITEKFERSQENSGYINGAAFSKKTVDMASGDKLTLEFTIKETSAIGDFVSLVVGSRNINVYSIFYAQAEAITLFALNGATYVSNESELLVNGMTSSKKDYSVSYPAPKGNSPLNYTWEAGVSYKMEYVILQNGTANLTVYYKTTEVTEYTSLIVVEGISNPWSEDVVMGIGLPVDFSVTTDGYSLTHYDASADASIDVLTEGYECYRTTVTEIKEAEEDNSGFNVLADSANYTFHYHGRPTGVSATADTITITTNKYGSNFYGFMLTKSAIDELVALGYTTLQFTITSDAPYVCMYSAVNTFIVNIDEAAGTEADGAYFASGSTVTIDLVMALRASGETSGILKYSLDYTSSVGYEQGYNRKHLKNVEIYKQIDGYFGDKKCVGVRVYEHVKKFENMDIPSYYEGKTDVISMFFSPSARMLAAQTIPTVYSGLGTVGIAFGENAKYLDDGALENGLILDITAANILQKAGIDVGLESCGDSFMAQEEYFSEEKEYIALRGCPAVEVSIKAGAKAKSFFVVDEKRSVAVYAYENLKGQKFLVFAFDGYSITEHAFKQYARGRQIETWIQSLGKKLPVSMLGNPDCYILCKENKNEKSVWIGNFFADECMNTTLILDKEYTEIQFINCKGRLKGNQVEIDCIAPYASVGFNLK